MLAKEFYLYRKLMRDRAQNHKAPSNLMAGTPEKITAFRQQIFSSNKYAFINSVNLHQNKKHKLKFTLLSMCNPFSL